MIKGGFEYIVTNKNNTVLYVGVTANLNQMILDHKSKTYKNAFSARYNCNKLVYFDCSDSIVKAIAKEKKLKVGSGIKKIELINAFNPNWDDLFDKIEINYTMKVNYTPSVLAAGPAVFRARDIYALLVDSVLYQDSANCSREGYARESLTPFAPKINNKVTEVKYFKAFPVPAKNSLNLSFNELKSAATVYVYDLEGRLILSKYINSNSRNAQLDLSQVPAGIYYVLLMNNERAERTKISVIK
jgi:putative endonuclease